MIWILAFLVAFDFIILMLIIPILSKRNATINKMARLERNIEILKDQLEKKLKEMEIIKDQLVFEKEKVLNEIKNLSLDVERKLKMASDLIKRSETERKNKLEIAKQLIKQGKKLEEISSELNIPLSEVKFIKNLTEKQMGFVENKENI